jgi:hypothetical protein
MIFRKIACLLLYYLGDLACRIGDGKCYQFFMLRSAEISDRYNLGIWKEIPKPSNEN